MPVTMEVGRTRSFDRSSPVHAYWLARCEGFEVRSGKEYGVVEDVALDSTNQALYLVVRFGLGRRREVPPSAVETVVPAEELLVVEAPPEPPPRVAPAARRAASVGRSGAEAGARATVEAASRGAQATAVAGAVAWCGAKRSAAATGRGSRTMSTRLAPHVVAFGRLVGWALYAGLAWAAVATMTVADRIGRHAPPAVRAAGHGVAAAAVGVQSKLAAAEERRPSNGLRSRRPQDDVRVVDDLGEKRAPAFDEPTLERMSDLRRPGRSKREP
jgi:hypothetical protein